MQQYDYKKVYGEMTKEDFIQALARISASALAFRGYQTAFENLKNRNPIKNYNALATWFRRYFDDLKNGVEGFSSFNNAAAIAKFDKTVKEMEEHKGDKQWWKDFINTRLSEINILLFPRWQQIIDMYAERFGDNAKTEPSETPISYEIKSEPTPEPEQEPEQEFEQEPEQEFESEPESEPEQEPETEIVAALVRNLTSDDCATYTLSELKQGRVPWCNKRGERPTPKISLKSLNAGCIAECKVLAMKALEKNNCLLTQDRKDMTIEIAGSILGQLNGFDDSYGGYTGERQEREDAAKWLALATQGDHRHNVEGFALRRVLRHAAQAIETVIEQSKQAQAPASDPKPMPKLESFQKALNHEASERYGADWVKRHVVFG